MFQCRHCNRTSDRFNPYAYQQMTLSPRLCAAGIIIRRHFKSPLLIQIFISVTPTTPLPTPTPRSLGSGMHFQTLLSPLLKVQRMELLNSLFWWELGSNLPGPGPGVWLSFWRVSSNNSDSDLAKIQVVGAKPLLIAAYYRPSEHDQVSAEELKNPWHWLTHQNHMSKSWGISTTQN